MEEWGLLTARHRVAAGCAAATLSNLFNLSKITRRVSVKAISVNGKSNKATNKRLSRTPPPSREEPKLPGLALASGDCASSPHPRRRGALMCAPDTSHVTLQSVYEANLPYPPRVSALFSLLPLSAGFLGLFLFVFPIAVAVHPLFSPFQFRWIINWLPPLPVDVNQSATPMTEGHRTGNTARQVTSARTANVRDSQKGKVIDDDRHRAHVRKVHLASGIRDEFLCKLRHDNYVIWHSSFDQLSSVG